MDTRQHSIDHRGIHYVRLTEAEIQEAIDHVFHNHFYTHKDKCQCGAYISAGYDAQEHIKLELLKAVFYGP